MRTKILLALAFSVLMVAVSLSGVSGSGCSLICGDINNNGKVTSADYDYLLSYMFRGGPAPPCTWQCDVNGDCSINVGDLYVLAQYLYNNGPAPHCDCQF